MSHSSKRKFRRQLRKRSRRVLNMTFDIKHIRRGILSTQYGSGIGRRSLSRSTIDD